ncbi:unnamed protein product [Cercospora beticola]|nr:unnamed protein product [Cercospora beticola]
MDNGAALVDMFTLLHNRTSPAPGNISGQRLLDLVVAIDFYDAKDALAHLLQTIVANVNTDETCGCHRELAITILDALTDYGLYTPMIASTHWQTSAMRSAPLRCQNQSDAPSLGQSTWKRARGMLGSGTIPCVSKAMPCAFSCIRRGYSITCCGDCALLDEEIENMSRHTGEELY